MTTEHFTFVHNDHTDRSPHKEVISDLFFYTGFVLLVALLCAVAVLAWGLLVKFSPKTVLMLQYLFPSVF